MHEIGLVEDILSAIRAKVKAKKKLKLKKVNILIGELEHIVQEDLEFHFRERTKGSALSNIELCFKKVEAKFRCKDCGCEFKTKDGIAGCPKCKSNLNDVIEGKGICVESVEIE